MGDNHETGKNSREIPLYVCAWCHKVGKTDPDAPFEELKMIRDNYLFQGKIYTRDSVSDGICPGCAEKNILTGASRGAI